MTFNVNADYFRAAAVCQSSEEARYYLNGVHIEPHAVKGVLLVATDGHRLIVIHDEEGSTDGSYIVGLDKDALKATKRGKREGARRLVADETGEVWVRDSEGGKLTFVKDPIVDGTFPDWRRVLPGGASESKSDKPGKLDWFNSGYLDAFSTAADAINGATGRSAIRIEPGNDGGPAIIRFSSDAPAFGVLMPQRTYAEVECGIPDFVHAQPVELAEAA